MRHFKIKTLSVSGNGNKIYRLHDVVAENKLPSESIEGWLSDGGIEEIAAPEEQPAAPATVVEEIAPVEQTQVAKEEVVEEVVAEETETVTEEIAIEEVVAEEVALVAEQAENATAEEPAVEEVAPVVEEPKEENPETATAPKGNRPNLGKSGK